MKIWTAIALIALVLFAAYIALPSLKTVAILAGITAVIAGIQYGWRALKAAR